MKALTASLLVWILQLSQAFAQAPPTRPSQLDEMVRHRLAGLERAHVEWSSIDHTGSGRELFYTSKYAAGDLLYAERGDRFGVTSPDDLGEAYSCADYFHFRNAAGQRLTYIEENLMGRFYGGGEKGGGPLGDFRVLGLTPLPRGGAQTSERLERMNPTDAIHAVYRVPFARYTVEKLADHIEHIVGYAADGVCVEWFLDASKGYAPTRITCRDAEGEGIARMDARLQEVDGRWYPREIRHYRNGKPKVTHHIHYACFDAQKLPAELDLNREIGLLPGVSFRWSKPDGKDLDLLWDGTWVTDMAGYAMAVDAGFVDTAALVAVLEEREAGYSPAAWPGRTAAGHVSEIEVAREPDLWEEYVKDFIKRNELTGDKKKQALEYGADCCRRANKYKREHAEEFEKTERLNEQIPANPATGDSEWTARRIATARHELTRQQNRLEQPIQRLFEDCLRERLLGLLSPKERRREELPRRLARAQAGKQE